MHVKMRPFFHSFQSHYDGSRCVPVQTITDPKASELKRRDHKHAIQRELDAVRKLQGALNVAAFEDAYEDEHSVYIVTELCRGGELWHRIGDKHYSERTVSTSAEIIMHPLAPSCNAGCKRQPQPWRMRQYLDDFGN